MRRAPDFTIPTASRQDIDKPNFTFAGSFLNTYQYRECDQYHEHCYCYRRPPPRINLKPCQLDFTLVNMNLIIDRLNHPRRKVTYLYLRRVDYLT